MFGGFLLVLLVLDCSYTPLESWNMLINDTELFQHNLAFSDNFVYGIYDTRCYFNVRSKTNMSHNLPKRQLKIVKQKK